MFDFESVLDVNQSWSGWKKSYCYQSVWMKLIPSSVSYNIIIQESRSKFSFKSVENEIKS